MSELSGLRAEYKELSDKNASPGWKADALKAKIAELKAAAGGPTVDEAAKAAAEKEATEQQASAEKDAADRAAAEQAEAERLAAEQSDQSDDEPELSDEDACAELGLSIEADGHCPVEMLESVSGGLNLRRGDPHRFEAAEAVRAVRAGIAKPHA